MITSREPDRAIKFRPGPRKGTSRTVGTTGRTHRELLLETGYALANELIRPTLANIAMRQPLLTEGYLRANSGHLAPCRELYRTLAETVRREKGVKNRSAGDGTRPPDPTAPFANVALLAERREARALDELERERRAHAETRRRLREAEAVRDRLLLGYADEI